MDGSVYDTTFVSNRASHTAEEISRDMGLTIASEVKRAKQQENAHNDPRREEVKDAIRVIAYDELSKGQRSITAFFTDMMNRGVDIEPARNKQGKVFGLRFSSEGYTFKASEIGREFGMRTLFANLGYKDDTQKGENRNLVYKPGELNTMIEQRSVPNLREQVFDRLSKTRTAPQPTRIGDILSATSSLFTQPTGTPDEYIDPAFLPEWMKKRKLKKKGRKR